MASSWKTVRVFISSTFRDMHAERDHLIKVTFPALREKLLPNRVELYDIDLRWGITEDEAKNEKVIGLCLDQVDGCRPFFLAFLGQRYGWVPPHVPADTLRRFPIVGQFPGASVTELELRHGLTVGAFDRHALILLRREEALATIPKPARDRDFQEADPRLRQMLAVLRQELAVGPYPVREYSAAWNPRRYDRITRKAGRLDNLDDFGKQVEDWLWGAIRTYLQLPETPAEVDPLDAETDLHERFLELRTRVYVGRDDVDRQLRSFALGTGAVPLLLTGASGLGKSAALARFVRDLRIARPDLVVLPHFVGASPNTTSLAGMLRRLTAELQRAFGLLLPRVETVDETVRAFALALARVPTAARVVLVLDGLDQLDADGRADSLGWLPDPLPPNVRVLCSAASEPASRTVAAFGHQPHTAVIVPPLTDEARRDIIRSVPKLVAKTLDSRQIEALLANPATRNPLFLTVALEELRGYGSFEGLGAMVAALPRGGDAVGKLFDQAFERLEQEFDGPLVSWTIGLLACSRHGLSGPELEGLTRHLGDRGDDLYPVLRQLRPYLVNRQNLIGFYHAGIAAAAERRYLRSDDKRRRFMLHLADYFEALPLNPRREDFRDERRLAEVPWQRVRAGDWLGLVRILAQYRFLSYILRHDQDALGHYVRTLESNRRGSVQEVVKKLLAAPHQFAHGGMDVAAYLLRSAGRADQAAEWDAKLIAFGKTHTRSDYLRAGIQARARRLLAGGDLGDLDQALADAREYEELCRMQAEWTEAQNLLARVHMQRGEPEQAMRVLGHHEAYLRAELLPHEDSEFTVTVPLHTGGSLTITKRPLKPDEESSIEFGNRQWRLELGTILLSKGELLYAYDRWREAEPSFREAEEIFRHAEAPAELARCLVYRTLLADRLGDPGKALQLHREAEGLYRRLGATEGLQPCLPQPFRVAELLAELPGRASALGPREDREETVREPSSARLDGDKAVCKWCGKVIRVSAIRTHESRCGKRKQTRRDTLPTVEEKLSSTANTAGTPAKTPSAPRNPREPSEVRIREKLDKVRSLVSKNKLDDAEALVCGVTWESPELQNARAVCRLRRGNIQTALELLGELCYPKGVCDIDIPLEVPAKYRVNFATALLLSGEIDRCEEVLGGIDAAHPVVHRLRAAIGQWRASRSWFQRLFGSSDPVRIDFPPGEI